MDKLIKLPLFLGIVGSLCGGVLSLTNHFTEEKIKKDEGIRANAAYIAHFSNIVRRENAELSDALIKSGIESKFYAYDESDNYIGSIYTVSANGYNPGIKFTISYANGKINRYVPLSHSETPNLGGKFLDWLAGDKNGELASNLEEGKISGVTVTFNGVNNAINACTADYNADQKNK